MNKPDCPQSEGPMPESDAVVSLASKLWDHCAPAEMQLANEFRRLGYTPDPRTPLGRALVDWSAALKTIGQVVEVRFPDGAPDC